MNTTLAAPQVPPSSTDTMYGLVYRGNSNIVNPSWEMHARPVIQHPGDAIVRITTTTICGTDLHILKGDLPSANEGRILGHEGVGVVEEVGPNVSTFHKGDRVLISCITSCGACDFCRRQMYSHCRNGGWILGNTIDGTQAEFVRIPYADTSLYALPEGADEEAAAMLSDILPTALECGVLNGRVKLGDTVAIVGTGPIGLAALMTAQFFSPASIICIDLDDNRLAVAKGFGATEVINSTDGKAAERVMQLTNGAGVDVAIEAVGLPGTFDICQSILAPGGHLANIGVHGKPVTLHMEKLWDRNATITTRLVDAATTPLLLKAFQAGKIQPAKLVTHRFALEDILEAYKTFGHAAEHSALKVVLKAR
jgi:alcohol dehydrogenase